jgi:hypothetical protein
MFESLRVVSRRNARPYSLSAQHGEGAFPFHTDVAHWSVPARYLLLRSDAASVRSTNVAAVRDSLGHAACLELFCRAVFLVRNGRHSFLASAFEPRLSLFRFDPGCMVPADRAARDVVEHLSILTSTGCATSVTWTAGCTVLVDNWRCMHSRGVLPHGVEEESRELRRALIEV